MVGLLCCKRLLTEVKPNSSALVGRFVSALVEAVAVLLLDSLSLYKAEHQHCAKIRDTKCMNDCDGAIIMHVRLMVQTTK